MYWYVGYFSLVMVSVVVHEAATSGRLEAVRIRPGLGADRAYRFVRIVRLRYVC